MIRRSSTIARLSIAMAMTIQTANIAVGKEPHSPAKPLLSSKWDVQGDCLTLPVKIGDKWHLFAVDTGSTRTVLDISFQSQLTVAGEVERIRTVATNDEAVYSPPVMLIAGTESGEIRFPARGAISCYDIAKKLKVNEVPFVGVLGMDFLENYALHLSTSKGRLELFESDEIRRKEGDTKLRFVMVDRQPFIKVRSHGTHFWAIVDTGAIASLFLQREIFQAFDRNDFLRPLEFEVGNTTGAATRSGSTGWLEHLGVGPFTHRQLYVSAIDDVSLLGLRYWSRYDCTFDFPQSSIYLSKGPYFNLTDDSDHAGIFVETSGKELPVVTYVAKGSAGDLAGVQRGDRLLSIESNDVKSDSDVELRQRLCFRQDRRCSLKMMRDGKEIQVTLPRSDMKPQQ